jgi:hypothetical protein
MSNPVKNDDWRLINEAFDNEKYIEWFELIKSAEDEAELPRGVILCEFIDSRAFRLIDKQFIDRMLEMDKDAKRSRKWNSLIQPGLLVMILTGIIAQAIVIYKNI